MPGSREVYNFRAQAWEDRGPDEEWEVPVAGAAGTLGGITKECRQPSVASQFLQWMSGPEMSLTLSPASRNGGPFRGSHLLRVAPWTGDEETAFQTAFAQGVEATWNRSQALVLLRIPQHRQYLARLAAAVLATRAGDKSASAALTEVAEQWNQLTDTLDREKQRQAYARSVGLTP